MPRPPNNVRLTREAFRLASDLMMDLVAGTQTFYLLSQRFDALPAPEVVRTSVTRLCLFHTIITLSKWTEFYDRYKAIIPEDMRDTAKTLRKEIHDRGIVEFRNKVVGHLWDEDQRRALTNAEIEDRLNELTRGDIPAFLKWVHDGKQAPSAETAAGMIEQVRDRIREDYGLSDDDLQH